ncbi:MAG TPA: hemerythrin domain-containing protein [Noviherbaspirillum sp.]|uniref:hemerythrin domain-containing protein n=1 Tax=Noviherbaspirillum sp. TaxID=1926288 RepID=UPI002D3B0361|nr:hemerythrin domain-containing protein [Noviherbaspirillum sp.]HYD95793.1 hemerythrin domain-containing protein [Noviherbaspirillum sp.]
MQTIAGYLGSDHKRCDDIFAAAETSVSSNDWDDAAKQLAAFAEALEHHLSMEEQVLFPEFESATGMVDGPTRVMRMEHQQLRSILEVLKDTLAKRDADGFFGYAETFNTMIQQHNMKEESILYVMTDNVLAGRRDEVIGAMREVGASA